MKKYLAIFICCLLLAGGCSRRREAPEAPPAEAVQPVAATPAPEATPCAHTRWSGGVCLDCGLFCLHGSWEDGVCLRCGLLCPHREHKQTTGACVECGTLVRHTFVNGRCACGAAPSFEEWELPEALRRPCPEQGRVVSVTYTTHNYLAEQYYGIVEEYEKPMTVYLPYGYDPEEKYDLLILLHGMGGSENYWLVDEQEYGEWSGEMIRTTDVLDNLIYQGYCDKMIVAAPTFYKDELDYTNYNPQTDAVLFWPELRGDILPYLAEHYATWCESGAEEDIVAARDHIGYVGLSMGSIIGFQSVLAHCQDMVSWVGCLSGFGSEPYSLAAQIDSEEFAAYPIHYLYNGCGTAGAAWEEHRAGYWQLVAACDKLTEGENTCFSEVQFVKHEYKGWIIGLYNCLQVFFRLPE